MKTIYTVLICILAINGFSQITIDSSDFASPGDTFTSAIGKNPSVIQVTGGAGATWDFSKLAADSLTGAKTRAIDKNNYPIDSLFPDAGMKITSNSYGESYLIKTKDSLSLDGIANLEIVPGNPGFSFNFNPNIKIMPFPLNYKDTFSSISYIDTIVDTAITALSFVKIKVHAEFYAYTIVEGYGKLMTSQDTVDVLKLYTVEAQSFEIYGKHSIAGWLTSPFITQNDTAHKYRWFAKGKGYQVAEAIADEKDGTTIEAYYLLSKDIFSYISNNEDPLCNGSSDGKVTVKATGGSGTYSYKWSHSGTANSSSISNLSAGLYSATVTDVLSKRTSSANILLKDPDTLSTILISKKDEGPLPNTGEAEISVTGGTPGYTYSWDRSSSTSKIASDLAGGIHVISIVDKNGCKKDTSISINSTVGLEELSSSTINFYPNPVKDYLKIAGLKGKANIVILDITGKIVLNKVMEPQKNTLYFKNLENGVYLIQVNDEGVTHSFRIIKE